LHQFEQQRPVVLIWDGLPAHHSGRMLDWLASQGHWLWVERLPGYAHDLNPIEQVWGNLKSKELANLCSNTIDEVADVAEDGLHRIGTDAPLCADKPCAHRSARRGTCSGRARNRCTKRRPR
jgi:transposase